MKKFNKIFSVAMAVILVGMSAVLPSFALGIPGSRVDFSLVMTKADDAVTDANGLTAGQAGGIYKMTVKMKATDPINNYQCAFIYDQSVIKPCWGDSSTGGTPWFDYVCDEVNGWTAGYYPLSTLADTNAYDAKGASGAAGPRISYYGPRNPSAKAVYIIEQTSDPSVRQTALRKAGNLPDEPNTQILNTQFKCSNTIPKGTLMPFGQTDLYEIFFKLQPGKTEADLANVNFIVTLTGVSAAKVFSNGDVTTGTWVGATSVPDDLEILAPVNNDTNVFKFVAPVAAGPAVASHKSEIRFNGVKPTPTSFDYRITSKILQADWDKYFAGTKAGAATNAITKVGAVAFDPVKGGTFDLAQAKTVAKAGASSGSYGYGSTTYIQKTATDAFFGCIIPGLTHTANNQDMQVLGFVEYKDATGAIQYIFYDAAATAAVNSKYDTALALWSK